MGGCHSLATRPAEASRYADLRRWGTPGMGMGWFPCHRGQHLLPIIWSGNSSYHSHVESAPASLDLAKLLSESDEEAGPG
eukprot:358767-Chlamydomonas_euryale.AAC.2